VAALSRESSTAIAVVSEPYTTLICERRAKYQTRKCRAISHSNAATTPPISAWRKESRPTGITR